MVSFLAVGKPLVRALPQPFPPLVQRRLSRCLSSAAAQGSSPSSNARTARLPEALEERVSQALEGMRRSGTFKTERIITTPQSSSIKVQNDSDKPVLNFCANNYLGLADRPE
ncbi:hypothetical protein GGH99_008448, partial [Coemansia sp. RSA 1285]